MFSGSFVRDPAVERFTAREVTVEHADGTKSRGGDKRGVGVGVSVPGVNVEVGAGGHVHRESGVQVQRRGRGGSGSCVGIARVQSSTPGTKGTNTTLASSS